MKLSLFGMKKLMKLKMITKLCDETKRMMITQLIGLGEAQRRVYEQFENEPEAHDRILRDAWEYHCKSQDALIKYQKIHNGN